MKRRREGEMKRRGELVLCCTVLETSIRVFSHVLYCMQ
jgi:hypothetical protein